MCGNVICSSVPARITDKPPHRRPEAETDEPDDDREHRGPLHPAHRAIRTLQPTQSPGAVETSTQNRRMHRTREHDERLRAEDDRDGRDVSDR